MESLVQLVIEVIRVCEESFKIDNGVIDEHSGYMARDFHLVNLYTSLLQRHHLASDLTQDPIVNCVTDLLLFFLWILNFENAQVDAWKRYDQSWHGSNKDRQLIWQWHLHWLGHRFWIPCLISWLLIVSLLSLAATMWLVTIHAPVVTALVVPLVLVSVALAAVLVALIIVI